MFSRENWGESIIAGGYEHFYSRFATENLIKRIDKMKTVEEKCRWFIFK